MPRLLRKRAGAASASTHQSRMVCSFRGKPSTNLPEMIQKQSVPAWSRISDWFCIQRADVEWLIGAAIWYFGYFDLHLRNCHVSHSLACRCRSIRSHLHMINSGHDILHPERAIRLNCKLIVAHFALESFPFRRLAPFTLKSAPLLVAPLSPIARDAHRM